MVMKVTSLVVHGGLVMTGRDFGVAHLLGQVAL